MREQSSDPAGKRYRIELICDGVPASAGSDAAIDIKEEFGHRPWHENVQCVWNGVALLLTAENDYENQPAPSAAEEAPDPYAMYPSRRQTPPFRQLVQLGETLESWKEEIATMWRFTRNNGITEGFHNKMETITRQAWGLGCLPGVGSDARKRH